MDATVPNDTDSIITYDLASIELPTAEATDIKPADVPSLLDTSLDAPTPVDAILPGDALLPGDSLPDSAALDTLPDSQVDDVIVTDGDTEPELVGPPDTAGETDTVSSDDVLCQPCPTNGACGVGNFCVPFPSGNFCATACEDNGDCPSGFLCFPYEAGTKACISSITDCTGCLVDGCPSGEYCDATTSTCQPAVDECGTCAGDAECGFGARCYSPTTGLAYCIPECLDGSCPASSTCETLTDQNGNAGVEACVPLTTDCCFGDACGTCAPECQEPTPICILGQCYECASGTDCPPEEPVCDPATHLCSDPDDGECDVCVHPYPGCAQYDGSWLCVPCSDDTHCVPPGTCNLQTFTCEGSPPYDYCSDMPCATDSDCYDPLGLFDLHCDPTSGCCYDSEGWCDDVAAFCTGAAQECLTLTGSLPGIFPAMPGGGEIGGRGFCACSEPGGVECILMPDTCASSECPTGTFCLNEAAVVNMLGGSGGTSKGICIDLFEFLDPSP